MVGVHSPEFAFEHVVSNVVAAAHQLGVHYPIAIDNNLATFNAYRNDGWPASLIDASGRVRNAEDGEGSYSATNPTSAPCWWRPTPRCTYRRGPTCPTRPRSMS